MKTKIDIKKENDLKMRNEIGQFHTVEAINIYNEAVSIYSRSDIKHIGEEKAMILLKRAIPHLHECKKLNYTDDRLKFIIEGIQAIMKNADPSDIHPIRL